MATVQTMLGLFLTLEEFRKAVKPGQTVYVWLPPDFERVNGIVGEGYGPGMTSPMMLFKMSEGIIQITDQNVFLFQPASKT